MSAFIRERPLTTPLTNEPSRLNGRSRQGHHGVHVLSRLLQQFWRSEFLKEKLHWSKGMIRQDSYEIHVE